jgi:hypothetical protein
VRKLLLGVIVGVLIGAPAASAMGPVASNVWRQIRPVADVRYVNQTQVLFGTFVIDNAGCHAVGLQRGITGCTPSDHTYNMDLPNWSLSGGNKCATTLTTNNPKIIATTHPPFDQPTKGSIDVYFLDQQGNRLIDLPAEPLDAFQFTMTVIC